MNNKLLILLALTALPLQTSAEGSRQNSRSPSVEVQGYALHNNNSVTYRYRVTNHSAKAISAIRIGHNYKEGPYIPGHGYSYLIEEYQLDVLPLGYNSLNDVPTPETSKSAPSGWVGEVELQEENPHHLFSWTIASANEPGIPAGQQLDGFSVTLPKADPTYLNSNFSVTFRSGSVYSDLIERVEKW